MIAEILAVGTELLLGQIVNTNAQYLSRRLAECGMDVYRHTAIGDNQQRVVQEVTQALMRCDVLIITGGLGPTQDDLTKEAVAQALGLKLVQDQDARQSIEAYFARIGRQMTHNNLRQSYFPQGATVLQNDCGTAPGCMLQTQGKTMVMLPGPPSEMQDMFTKRVMPVLSRMSGSCIISRVVRIIGMGESAIEDAILPLLEKQTNPTVAPLIGQGDVTLRITAKAATMDEAMAMLDPVEAQIRDIFGNSVYAVGEEPMHKVVAKMLMEQGETLAVAESCTGGQIADRLMEVPGISKVFIEGIVAYANEAKMRHLGVSADLLFEHGAVSSQCAMAMAKGVRQVSGADYGLATTGIAGPNGGTQQKPVGLVYIAVDGNNGCQVIPCQFGRNRDRNRMMATLYALNLLRETLIKDRDSQD